MDKQKTLAKLRNAETIYTLVSACTKMPFVHCDEETFDDEILIYFSEEDIKRGGQKLIDKKHPVQVVKVDQTHRLHFFTNLYTMGVNAILVNGFLEDELRIQLPELVNRPGLKSQSEGKVWLENPELHLTSLYFMQEVRRQKLDKLTGELNEMQDEIIAHFQKGKYIAVLHNDNGIPLLKQPNGDVYQPIFTDALEFQKFGNKDKQFKAVVVDAQKLPEVLASDAKGVVVNPFGVNLQLPIMRKAAPGKPAAGQPIPERPVPGQSAPEQPASGESISKHE